MPSSTSERSVHSKARWGGPGTWPPRLAHRIAPPRKIGSEVRALSFKGQEGPIQTG